MYNLSYIVLGCLAVTLLNILIPLARNIRTARATGIPYVIVPVYAYNRINSILFARIISRILDSILSTPSTTSWRRLTGSAWAWKLRHAPFADLGTDTFLTVAPGGIILYTADASVITQINARGNDFPKATQLYKHVDIYGKNVVSSGGETWRRHRSVTSTAFTEKNNQLVWKETLEITKNVLESWVPSDESDKTIRTVASDSMRLSLEVIGRAGLGQRLDLFKVTEKDDEARSRPRGHQLTFTEALQFLLVHIFYIIAVPRWFLKNSPFKKLNRCYEAFTEWGKYLEEMVTAKREATQSEKSDSSGVDLIGQLIKAQSSNQSESLSDSDVTGNLFMFIIAGHETSANSIHFSILLLALNPSIQRKVQHELSTIFKDRPVSAWSYESDLPRLLNSILAAVLNEELRLIGPVIAIPKTVNSTPQQLSINDRDCVLPANTMIRLCIPSVHRNPNCWPTGPPRDPQNPAFPLGNLDNDLEEFKPERWLKSSNQRSITTRSLAGRDNGTPLYVPPKGAFIPFSDGQRACLGKRFAQVEILAALAVIFSEYSVELAVDEWATYEDVAGMGKEERGRVWTMAEEKAKTLLRDKVVSIITLQMRGAHVPVRFVKRGAEMFGDL